VVKVTIKKIKDNAVVPCYVHPGDAGVDLYSTETYTLQPQERTLVSTGLEIAVPQGYEAQIRPKSGLALNHGLTILNTPGTIDSGYRGEVGILIINQSKEPYTISSGKKIAQMVFNKIETVEFMETDQLDETQRGKGGFGSTGL